MKSRIAAGLAGLIVMAGCGKDEKSAGKNGADGGNHRTTNTSEAEHTFPSDKATATIRGRVRFSGAVPSREELRIGKQDTFCELSHKAQPILSEKLIVSGDKTVRNVVVYVKS